MEAWTDKTYCLIMQWNQKIIYNNNTCVCEILFIKIFSAFQNPELPFFFKKIVDLAQTTTKNVIAIISSRGAITNYRTEGSNYVFTLAHHMLNDFIYEVNETSSETKKFSDSQNN